MATLDWPIRTTAHAPQHFAFRSEFRPLGILQLVNFHLSHSSAEETLPVRLRDLTSVTCYTRLKREPTRSGYALYTQVRVRMYVRQHDKTQQSKAKAERHLQSSGQFLLRKPNVKNVHCPWPLLYGPLLLRRKSGTHMPASKSWN